MRHPQLIQWVMACTLIFGCSKSSDDDDDDDSSPSPAASQQTLQTGSQPTQQQPTGGGAPATAPEPVYITNSAPVVGGSGTLTLSSIKADKVTLNWTKATDKESNNSALKYIVYVSTTNNINTIDNAEANGTPFEGYKVNIATLTIDNLSPTTTYYFNVLVKDTEGKQATYKSASTTTTSFPVPGGAGVVTASHDGADLKVDWTKGVDGLSYRLYYSLADNITTVDDITTNGIAVGSSATIDLQTKTIVGPQTSTRYYLNILVADADGNLAVYNGTSFNTDSEVFISYHHNTNRDLHFIKRPIGQSWITPVDIEVGATQTYQYASSLRVTSDGLARIAFHMTNDGAGGTHDLYYAEETPGGTFNKELVATISNLGYYPAIDLKSDDSPAIAAFATDVGGDLYYYEPLGAGWSMQRGFSEGSNTVGYWNDMVFDNNDNAHICTHHVQNGDLYYVTNESGSWVGELVDGAEDVGDYCSIGIDQAGKIHISYYNVTNLDLNYSTNASGSWVRTDIDTTGTTGTYTSLDIDSNGFVHISYYNGSQSDVYYATNKSGTWTTESVDGTGFTAGNAGTSLKLDNLNRPHIAYYDGTNAALKYAYRATDISSWETETLHDDGANQVGYFPSIDVK